MLGTCLHMMQGTPYIYQGEELGMTNVPFGELSQFRDIESLNAYKELVESGKRSPEEMMRLLHRISRDHARTPMQWSETEENAGFTTGSPWIMVNPNYTEINAEAQLQDPDSVFRYYQRLIRLRKEHGVVVYGDFQPLYEEDPALIAYRRTLGDQALLVFCQFGKEPGRTISLAELGAEKGRLLLTNYPAEKEDSSFTLRPYEARVYLVQK